MSDFRYGVQEEQGNHVHHNHSFFGRSEAVVKMPQYEKAQHAEYLIASQNKADPRRTEAFSLEHQRNIGIESRHSGKQEKVAEIVNLQI